MARDAGQLRLLAESLAIGSVAANMAGDRTSARRLLDESQVAAEGVDDVAATLAFLQARSLDGFFEGDLDTVRASSSEGVRLSRETGDTYGLEMLINLGSAALLAASSIQAQRSWQRRCGSVTRSTIGGAVHPARLVGLPCRQLWPGRRAAQLLGAAGGANRGWRNPHPNSRPLVAGAEASAIAALGASASRPSSHRKALSRDAAMGTASRPCRRRDSRRCGVAPLARREADVARLVAEGLSNKQIGARLFISERTVDSHIRSILNKLGFNSTSPDRRLDGVVKSVARRQAALLSIAGRGPRRGGPSRARPDASQLTPGRSSPPR